MRRARAHAARAMNTMPAYMYHHLATFTRTAAGNDGTARHAEDISLALLT